MKSKMNKYERLYLLKWMLLFGQTPIKPAEDMNGIANFKRSLNIPPDEAKTQGWMGRSVTHMMENGWIIEVVVDNRKLYCLSNKAMQDMAHDINLLGEEYEQST